VERFLLQKIGEVNNFVTMFVKADIGHRDTMGWFVLTVNGWAKNFLVQSVVKK
jgi:hypothetical protein